MFAGLVVLTNFYDVAWPNWCVGLIYWYVFFWSVYFLYYGAMMCVVLLDRWKNLLRYIMVVK